MLWQHYASSICQQGLIVSFLSGQTVDTLSGCGQDLSGSLTFKRYSAYLLWQCNVDKTDWSNVWSTIKWLYLTCNFTQSWFGLCLRWLCWTNKYLGFFMNRLQKLYVIFRIYMDGQGGYQWTKHIPRDFHLSQQDTQQDQNIVNNNNEQCPDT